MRSSTRWWMLGLVLPTLLVSFACTGNSLDDGDSADVVLEVLNITNPAVTGTEETGRCSVSTDIECLSSDNCPDTEVCIPPLIAGECTITTWSAQVIVVAKSDLVGPPPFNTVYVESADLEYDWDRDGSIDLRRPRVPIGIDIPAGGTAAASFYPIAPEDLVVDNTIAYLWITFNGRTESGERVTGQSGKELFIEPCIGGN